MVKRKEEEAELRELLGLEPVNLVVKKGRLRWCGHAESKDDTDWINHCSVMEVEGIKPRGRLWKTWWDGTS